MDQAFLQEQEVEPWMGPGAIPLWLPRPEYDGLPAHDVRPSLDAGLTLRPLAETTRDTLAWLRGHPGRAVVSGIDLDRERELLAAWHARGSGCLTVAAVSVVNFLGLDRCQVVEGFVGPLGVEPVDPLQGARARRARRRARALRGGSARS